MNFKKIPNDIVVWQNKHPKEPKAKYMSPGVYVKEVDIDVLLQPTFDDFVLVSDGHGSARWVRSSMLNQ